MVGIGSVNLYLAVVQAGHNGQALATYATFIQHSTSLLERLLDNETHAFNRCTSLLAEVEDAQGCIAVGQEIVDEEQAVALLEVTAADGHLVFLLFGKGKDGGRELVFHRAGGFLLDKHHGEVHDETHHDGWGDATGLDGYDFVDVDVRKTCHEFTCHVEHQVGVHLMVDEAVHLQYAAGKATSFLEDAFLEQIHAFSHLLALCLHFSLQRYNIYGKVALPLHQNLETMNPKQLRIEDYNYPLPDERIAKFPLTQRDQSKLLLYRGGEVSEDTFVNLPKYLPSGALMVFNNTRVIQARLHFNKETGAKIEIFCLEPALPQEYQENFSARGTCSWYCLVGNLKKWKEGTLTRLVQVNGTDVTVHATREGVHGTSHLVRFHWEGDATWAELLDAMGELPIPPYLNRNTEESDKTTYQTVYSKIKGSVAAPTAGLHFTPEVLAAIDAAGIEREEVTLHVGAGTFKPVKSEEIGGHEMHTEHISVSRHTVETLIAHGGEAIAVGTTSVRTLESLYYMGVISEKLKAENEKYGQGDGEELHVSQWMPYEYAQEEKQLSTIEALQCLLNYMDANHIDILHSSTQIIIAPGYVFHIVKRIVTNFHQPQSTLLLLVSAFVRGDWRCIYDYALAHDFRFLSYGDSSLLVP